MDNFVWGPFDIDIDCSAVTSRDECQLCVRETRFDPVEQFEGFAVVEFERRVEGLWIAPPVAGEMDPRMILQAGIGDSLSD
jgi:hypothetical protein